jgi:hypothetical protein
VVVLYGTIVYNTHTACHDKDAFIYIYVVINEYGVISQAAIGFIFTSSRVHRQYISVAMPVVVVDGRYLSAHIFFYKKQTRTTSLAGSHATIVTLQRRPNAKVRRKSHVSCNDITVPDNTF